MNTITGAIRPLHDKILIERLEASDKSEGGIFIPETAKEKPVQGRVVAVGDGRLLSSGGRAKPQVKSNDLVIFNAYAGAEIKTDSGGYLILSEDDILAIVDFRS